MAKKIRVWDGTQWQDVAPALPYTAVHSAQASMPSTGVDGQIWLDTDGTLSDTAFVPLSTIDAKGDLLVGTADNTVNKLTAGSNDTVLTADSSTATGLKWATPSAGGMTLLSTTTLSGTKTTISSISSAYTDLYILIYGVTNQTTNGNFRLLPNDALGCSYFRADYGTTTLNQQINTYLLFNNQGASNLYNNANNVYQLTIHNYASTTTRKPFIGSGIFVDSNLNNAANFYLGAVDSTTAISSLAFTMSNGTSFNGGTVLVYGVK